MSVKNIATMRQKAPAGKGRNVTELVVQDLDLRQTFVRLQDMEQIYGCLFNIALYLLQQFWPADKLTRKKFVTQLKNDLKARSEMGIKKYGEPLTAFNGRDAALDLYQEILDAIVYARQDIEERPR